MRRRKTSINRPKTMFQLYSSFLNLLYFLYPPVPGLGRGQHSPQAAEQRRELELKRPGARLPELLDGHWPLRGPPDIHVCTYMHICTCTYIYMHTHTLIHTYIRVFMCIHIHVELHIIYLYVCMYNYMYTCRQTGRQTDRQTDRVGSLHGPNLKAQEYHYQFGVCLRYLVPFCIYAKNLILY